MYGLSDYSSNIFIFYIELRLIDGNLDVIKQNQNKNHPDNCLYLFSFVFAHIKKIQGRSLISVKSLYGNLR